MIINSNIRFIEEGEFMRMAPVILIVVVIATLAIGAYLAAQDMGYSTVNAGSGANIHGLNTTSSNVSYTIKVAYNSSIGYYLTNSTGEALYYYKVDKPNTGTSACNGGCSGTWPAFYTNTLTVPSSLSASSFNTITRTNGAKQLTYNGYPLYHFVGDTKSGEANGNGIGGVWYAYAITSANATAP